MKRRRVPINIKAMPPDRPVPKLVTRALAVIAGLDAVGLAIGCVLRRRRG